MIASIGSGVAKCAAESTVKGAARKAEAIVVEKVVAVEEKIGVSTLSRSASESKTVTNTPLGEPRPSSELKPEAKATDDDVSKHFPAAISVKYDSKYQNALDESRRRFKESGSVGSLGRLTEIQSTSLNIKVQPPPISGLAVVPTDQAVWSHTFSSFESGTARTASATASENDLRNAIKSKVSFDASNISTSISSIPKDIGELRMLLATDKSPIYVVVGHNEGGKFVIPPNHRILLGEMADACNVAGKICVFFSCESDKVVQNGVRREITFLEADELLSEVKKLTAVALEQGYTLRDFAGALPNVIQATENRQERRKGIQFIARALPPIAFVGGGLAVMIGTEKKPR